MATRYTSSGGLCPPARSLFALVLALVMPPSIAVAGTVTTTDGSALNGRIITITQKEVVIETPFAGKLMLKTAMIATIDAPETVTVKLEDGTEVTGTVKVDDNRALTVESEMMRLETRFSHIAAAWRPGATPPVESGYEPPRRWHSKIGVDVAGREGNSDELATNIAVDAKLKSPDDELHLYATLERAERNAVETADETIAGAAYTAYYNEPWGWYVRGEVERDDFENLELRTTLGGGVSYRLLNREAQTLEILGGLGYRYESFLDGRTDNSPTVEFGADHFYEFAPWLTIENRLSFAPQVSNFSDYLVVHDSAFELPVGPGDRWKVRFGIRNDYNALPAENRKKLDTSYYSRVLLDF